MQHFILTANRIKSAKSNQPIKINRPIFHFQIRFSLFMFPWMNTHIKRVKTHTHRVIHTETVYPVSQTRVNQIKTE